MEIQITHRATCAYCEQPIEGGTRELGLAKRYGWRHIKPTDIETGGLHAALPDVATIVEI